MAEERRVHVAGCLGDALSHGILTQVGNHVGEPPRVAVDLCISKQSGQNTPLMFPNRREAGNICWYGMLADVPSVNFSIIARSIPVATVSWRRNLPAAASMRMPTAHPSVYAMRSHAPRSPSGTTMFQVQGRATGRFHASLGKKITNARQDHTTIRVAKTAAVHVLARRLGAGVHMATRYIRNVHIPSITQMPLSTSENMYACVLRNALAIARMRV